MKLTGLHHVTAVSAQIGRNVDFYTRVLGLRLVKKSVNQDDVSAYHLFYADKVGSPGTDMTFFDWPQIGPDQRGTDSVVLTAFRVNGPAAIEFWRQRLTEMGAVVHAPELFAERALLRFEDPEGQRLALVDDGGAGFEGEVWEAGGVPNAYALRGFQAVMLSVPAWTRLDTILTRVLQLRQGPPAVFPDGHAVRQYAFDAGGPGREVWVAEAPHERSAQLGAGGVHHVAFRVADEAGQQAWHERLLRTGLPVSPLVDRYYFRSIYFRVSNGLLFEIATDGPGFAADEPVETLGQRLALPPFLEPRRAEIEAGLKPITVSPA